MFCGLVPVLVLGSGCGVIAPSPTATPVPTSVAASTSSPSVSPSSTATATTTRKGPPPTVPQPGCGLPGSLLGRDLTTIPGSARVVALTFDAGGSDGGLSPILKTLKERAAPATFFLTGRFTQTFPEASRTIAKEHPVGNHTENHRDLTKLPTTTVRAEIRDGESSILTATGVNPRPYFRFPLGARNPETIEVANAECYIPFRWTVDTLGWQGTEGKMSADKVYQRIIQGLQPGAIILMHVGANPDDGTTFDADALPRIIDAIRDRGYKLVTLEQVLPETP